MAKSRKPSGKDDKAETKKRKVRRFRPVRWLLRWVFRIAVVVALILFAFVLLFSVVNPPLTHTMFSEWRRVGPLDRNWVAIEDIAPVMARSVVAAEDANCCLHWGFDVEAIKAAIDSGAARGGSTLSQQVVKNVFLWQGRSWIRKALETAITPMVEAVWSKRRIIEVYLNVAETGEGVFGVAAAARRAFDVTPDRISARQAPPIAAGFSSPQNPSLGGASAAPRPTGGGGPRGGRPNQGGGPATFFAGLKNPPFRANMSHPPHSAPGGIGP
ncbi:MAG: transglycosylase domain-containing protein, partial [Arenibacterium sp.]